MCKNRISKLFAITYESTRTWRDGAGESTNHRLVEVSARDDYPAELHVYSDITVKQMPSDQYDAAMDELDHLRAPVLNLRSAATDEILRSWERNEVTTWREVGLMVQSDLLPAVFALPHACACGQRFATADELGAHCHD